MRRRCSSRATRALILVGAALAAGCADSPVTPEIVDVTPAEAYNNGTVRLTIATRGVRPVLDIDLGPGRLATPIASIFELVPEAGSRDPMAVESGSGTGSGVANDVTELDNVGWLAADSFAADAVAVRPGTYAVAVINPDGRRAIAPQAFTSLGPDFFPPTVTLLEPPDLSALQAGQTVSASIAVDDGPGQLMTPVWSTEFKPLRVVTSQSCTLGQGPPAPDRRQIWLATFIVPTPPDGEPTAAFHFSVTVQDGGGNTGHLDADFIATRKPVIVELAPTRGGMGGGQPFTLRGTSLLPGARVWFDAVEAIAVTVRDAPPPELGGTIVVGTVPPHARAETVGVSVETAGGRATARDGFMYLAPPRIRGIEPALGPGRGGIRVTVKGSDFREHTKVFMGTWPGDKRELLDCSNVLPPDKVTGALRPGAGTVQVWAEDPDLGTGLVPPETLPMTFVDDDTLAIAPLDCPPTVP